MTTDYGDRLKTADIQILHYEDIAKCPFIILMPDHYRKDGSCRCDDAQERKKMIAEWEYTEEQFKDIPLRRK